MSQVLAKHGWSQEAYDVCWLDCGEQGHLLQWHHSEICLCPVHAELLESGYLNGTYAGAPLPPDSVAVSWPWRRQLTRVVAVV